MAKTPANVVRLVQKQQRPLALFDKPLTGIAEALHFGRSESLREVAATKLTSYRYDAGGVGIASRIRAENIWLFPSADRTLQVLSPVLAQRLDRESAVTMIGAMLGAFRAKGDKDVLTAMLDLLEGDDIARASGLWRPVEATPAALALACRKLIATAKFVPQPSELLDAVREAQIELASAHGACESVIELLQIADAVMLEFAPREEWIKPWQSRDWRPMLARMLAWHEQYGAAAGQYPGQSEMKGITSFDEDKEEDVLTAFGVLVKREQANLKALVAPAAPKRIAACKTTLPTKRMRKPRRR